VYKRVYNYFVAAIPEKAPQPRKQTPVNSPAAKTRPILNNTPAKSSNGTPLKYPTSSQARHTTRTPSKLPHTSDQTPTKTSTRKRTASFADVPVSSDHDAILDNGVEEADELHDEEEPELPRYKKQRAADQAMNPRSGLGTMFVEGVDWLSEENRAEYLSWSRGIRKQIQQLERA
jgi:hypothetical protein